MTSSSPEYDRTPVIWRKSSYSGGEGGNCVEVAAPWRKSSYSGGDGGDCLEVADAPAPHTVPVRDSKVPDGPRLTFPGPVWQTFLAGLKRP